MSTKLKAGTATSGAVIDADTSGILELQTGSTPTTAITVDASQNVGIGTSSPAYKLHVYQSNSGNSEVARFYGAATYAGISTGDATTTQPNYILATGNNQTFWTAGSERMRIDSNGKLGVGTTTLGGKFNVVSTGSACNDFRTTDANDVIYIVANTGGSSGSAVYVMPCRFGSTQTFGGGVYWTGSVMQYTGTSDARLKENIVDSNSGLEKLANVKVRSFDWKESGSHVDFGVIAQELEEIAPEAVAKGKDNEDGTINTPYAVDTSVLVPAMIKAIQELNAKVEALEAQLGAK